MSKDIIVNVRTNILRSSRLFYGWSLSPFGETLIFLNNNEVSALGFKNGKDKLEIEFELKALWKNKCITYEEINTSNIIEEIFFKNCTIDIVLQGTHFQLKVWNALLTIPSGTTTHYADIAKKIGNPQSIRAVASAIAKNPIAWLIPCHRVLRKSGDLGGYRWGENIKRRMLSSELLK